MNNGKIINCFLIASGMNGAVCVDGRTMTRITVEHTTVVSVCGQNNISEES